MFALPGFDQLHDVSIPQALPVAICLLAGPSSRSASAGFGPSAGNRRLAKSRT